MQSNILAQVEHLLREKKFNIDVDKFVQYLRIVKDNWIYPDAVQRHTKSTIVEIYNVLEYLTESGYLEQALVVYCPNCNRFIGNYYKTIYDLPGEEYCPHNDCVIKDVVKNAIVVYREKMNGEQRG